MFGSRKTRDKKKQVHLCGSSGRRRKTRRSRTRPAEGTMADGDGDGDGDGDIAGGRARRKWRGASHSSREDNSRRPARTASGGETGADRAPVTCSGAGVTSRDATRSQALLGEKICTASVPPGIGRQLRSADSTRV